MVRRRFKRVAKDKKTGIAKKYLSGAKNKSAKAAEIKRTAEAYKSRTKQDGSKKKTTVRRRRKKS